MTAAQTEAALALKQSFAHSPIVIIGNGPVGVKAAQLILTQSDYHHIVIYGDEKYAPYNRVQLSLYLAGKIDRQQLANPVSVTKSERLTEFYGKRVVSIDFKRRLVIDNSGFQQNYSKLIIATGSSAFVPSIEGMDKPNVYTFRTLEDANNLIECRRSKQHIYVIGSGALGLETALAMKTPDNNVSLEVRDKLLSRQLDHDANKILQERILSSGVNIVHRDPVVRVIGATQATQVELASGRRIDIDALVICAGIRPNTQLVANTSIQINKGILVNDFMETSEPNVYAIGECAEHNGATYGIVAPGFEQAETCVKHILGSYHKYTGSLTSVHLKIDQHKTSICGSIDQGDCDTYSYSNRLKGVFRKLLVKNKVIVGMIVIGEWSEEHQVKNWIQEKRKVSSKQLKHFEQTGLLWNKSERSSITAQPENYIVCLCQGITRGELSKAMDEGNRTLETLCRTTGAGLTCGSCKPLVAELLDMPLPNLVMRHHKLVFGSSILSLLIIALLVFSDPITASISVQPGWKIEKLWYDNFWKQVSGYTLLALCLIGSAISARKRWSKLKQGNIDNWRLFHAITGVVALLVLIVHTGFQLGNNLNFALMAVFLAATTTGSLVGVFMSKNHHWSDLKLREHRKWWSRVHYTLLWLLPALLFFHILSVYFF
jgi:nitrite reductase (NADH) large subunit